MAKSADVEARRNHIHIFRRGRWVVQHTGEDKQCKECLIASKTGEMQFTESQVLRKRD